MKNLLLLLTTLAFVFCANSSMANNLIIGVSPYIPDGKSQAVFKQVVTHALEELEAGETATIYDAYHLQSVATITIPNEAAYQHVRTRAHMNSDAIKRFRDFAAQNSATGNQDLSSVVRLPEFLRWIGQNRNVQSVDVVVIGSPLYHNHSQPAFSMKTGNIPGDGHLQTSVSRTVFGIDDAELLSGMRLHIGYPEDFAEHDQHQWHVQRFWTLFAELQGAELISFTGDLSMLLNRVDQKANKLNHSYVLKEGTKLEMIQLAPVQLQESSSIFERPVETQALPTDQLDTAKNVQIGIKWDSCRECDLDLHVRPHASAEVLYFGRTQTAEGRYWKDFRNAPAYGYETIDLSEGVDLRDLLIAVNFYSGSTSAPVNAGLRLSVGNKTYAYPFQIDATSGNQGKGGDVVWRSRRAAFPQWKIIDPMKVVSSNK